MSITNTVNMLKKAQNECYAVGAFNVENMEFVQAVIEAAEELKAPVIVATSVNTLKYATPETFCSLLNSIVEDTSVPVAIHLDHGETYMDVMRAIRGGYKSVMYDGSKYSYIDNMNQTRKIVEICSYFGISVEGELGAIGGKPGDPNIEDLMYTKPETAADFVAKTGVNSLAVAIGTAHGIYNSTPKLDYVRLEKIRAAVDVPLVLHGASGLSDDQLKNCVERGITKVNIATELRMAWTKTLRLALEDRPDKYDPKIAAKEAKKEVKKIVMEKINVLGSAGKAKC